MNKTSIEWCDFTINPIRFRNRETGKVGHYCEKISPGCKNCYASTMQKGPYLSGLEYIATNKDNGEIYFDESVLQQVLKRRKPARIFWCDMTDLFGEWVPDEWIDRCFAVMALTPQHTHQILTKRAERMRQYMTCPSITKQIETQLCLLAMDGVPIEEGVDRSPWPLPNVWLGVSIEDCARKDRIDWLRKTPAAVRFLSCEPLLEDLGELDLTGISWVICGGESGPGARPCNVEWNRAIVRQCKAAYVACFVKQLGGNVMGEWPEFPGYDMETHGYPIRDRKGGNPDEWPRDLMGAREYPR